MRILGLDPGSRATGFGVVAREGGETRARAFGVVRPPRERPFAERLSTIHETVRRIVVEHAPDVVVVEEVFLGKDARGALRLGEARGVCVLAARLEGRKVVELSPALVKKAVAGSGSASKVDVRSAVRATLGLAMEDRLALDASDALALAIAAQARLETVSRFGIETAAFARSGSRRGGRWGAADIARLEHRDGGAR